MICSADRQGPKFSLIRVTQVWQQGSASSFFTVYTAISKLCVHTTMQRPQTHDFPIFDFPILIFYFLISHF